MGIPRLPGNWREILRTCDFFRACDELRYFVRMANREDAYFRAGFAKGVEAFLANPCFESAIALIEGAPEEAWMAWKYFSLSCAPPRNVDER